MIFFFAFIRACYNQRVNNPVYRRLSFALLGVATPSDLIKDKTRTPFNIGRAIELNGFDIHETHTLAVGLADKVSNPQEVLKQVLIWTGGQPFLTQKLCQIIYTCEVFLPITNEAEWVEELVKVRLLENWEAQDNPEHLRTIRDRIVRSKQRAGRLLGLYQQILQQGEVVADHSPEQTELQLSGLVVKQQGTLTVYNAIYASIFHSGWVAKELANLRPYAEAIDAWVVSHYQDRSRLLRGQALQEALDWASGKSLSNQDYQFLSASQELEKQEVQLALKAAEKANQILAEAQHKANQTIHKGFAGLAVISSVVVILWILTSINLNRALQKEKVAHIETQKANKKLVIAEEERQKITQQIYEKNLELEKIKNQQANLEKDNKIASQKISRAETRQKSAEKQTQISQQNFRDAEAKLTTISLTINKKNEESQKAAVKYQNLQTQYAQAQNKLKEVVTDLKHLQSIVYGTTNKTINSVVLSPAQKVYASETIGNLTSILEEEGVKIFPPSNHSSDIFVQGETSKLIVLNEEALHNDIYSEYQSPTDSKDSSFAERSLTTNRKRENEDIISLYKTCSRKILQIGNSGSAVLNLQKQLKKLGFYTGASTGYFDSSTEASVIKLQKAMGITADGKICQDLLNEWSSRIGASDKLTTRLSSVTASQIDLRESRKNSTQVHNEATGNAGNINITTRLLNVQEESQISSFLSNKLINSTSSSQGNGGNINLDSGDLLLLSNGSNIAIDSRFVVAVPKENSDVTANAFTNKGGNLSINVQNIFGIEARPQQTNQSEQTAGLELGLRVKPRTIVETPPLEAQPPEELLEPPTELLTNFGQNYESGREITGSQKIGFIITGRGGLPPKPSGNVHILFATGFNTSLDDFEGINSFRYNNKILELQKWLHARGFYNGPLDGIWGKQTQEAIEAFQSYYGITN